MNHDCNTVPLSAAQSVYWRRSGEEDPGETSRVIQFLTTLTAEPGNIFQ